MGTVPLYDGERLCGQAELWRSGLYLCARARTDAQGLCRAALEDESGERVWKLGVLAPEGEAQTCTARRPVRDAPLFVRGRVLRQAQWRPCERTILKKNPKNAVFRPWGEGVEISVPFRPDEPFELLPLFCFFRLTQRADGFWLNLCLRSDGSPAFPDL